MQNEALKIAKHHLDLSYEEITECANKVYEKIDYAISKSDNHDVKETLLEALALLQAQDIVTQRITKLKDFLQLLDRHVNLEASQEYLEEFAWENEVDQNDIDAMISQYKG